VVAVLAEKPSVARDIAKVLGATTRGEGYLQGNGYVVTWAIGHLASLAQPHEIDPQWKVWRRETLPMVPEVWPLVVYEKTKDQFEIVRKILSSPPPLRSTASRYTASSMTTTVEMLARNHVFLPSPKRRSAPRLCVPRPGALGQPDPDRASRGAAPDATNSHGRSLFDFVPVARPESAPS
jgi:hypothetical protein